MESNHLGLSTVDLQSTLAPYKTIPPRYQRPQMPHAALEDPLITCDTRLGQTVDTTGREAFDNAPSL